MKSKLKKTERGWKGHYICCDRCQFSRNTLLEFEKKKIVVSTIGMMRDFHAKDGFNKPQYERIHPGRYYETMVFYAKRDGRFWDANIMRQINIDANWIVDKLDAEDKANDMHEEIVKEISKKLKQKKL